MSGGVSNPCRHAIPACRCSIENYIGRMLSWEDRKNIIYTIIIQLLYFKRYSYGYWLSIANSARHNLNFSLTWPATSQGLVGDGSETKSRRCSYEAADQSPSVGNQSPISCRQTANPSCNLCDRYLFWSVAMYMYVWLRLNMFKNMAATDLIAVRFPTCCRLLWGLVTTSANGLNFWTCRDRSA